MLVYNPYAADVVLNPYPVYRRLRDEAPAYHNEEMGFWAITRYGDVLDAFLNPTALISSEGNLIDGADKGSGFLIGMDPPEHQWYRRIMSRVFTPREVTNLEPFVREMAAGYLDAVAGEPRFDLVRDFAVRLPLDVIGELLGIPAELRAEVHELSNRLTARAEGDQMSAVPEDAQAASQELGMLIYQLVVERRKSPRDDLISNLIDATVTDDDGRTWHMPDEHITAQCLMLAFAGHETVTGLIGSGAVALWWYPDQRRELVGDPGLIKPAVEEMLRWDSPAPLEGRWSARDYELHGVTIPEGSRVMLLTGAANHDERQYENPELFDIHRSNARPLGFGFGIHLCLGAALARLEGRVAFEELLRRYPDYEIDPSGVVRSASPSFRGHARLPVVVG